MHSDQAQNVFFTPLDNNNGSVRMSMLNEGA